MAEGTYFVTQITDNANPGYVLRLLAMPYEL